MSETAVSEIETQPAFDIESVSNLETTVSKADNNPDIRERVKLLYFQGVRPEVICSETGVKRGTLRTWINRYGWLRTVHAAQAMLTKRGERVVSFCPVPESSASQRTRTKLGNALEKVAAKLEEYNPKASLRDIRKVGKALEPLVRSAKIIHGWGNEGPTGLVMAGMLAEDPEPVQAIDIDSEPVNDSNTRLTVDNPPGNTPALPQDASVPAPATMEQQQASGGTEAPPVAKHA
jgi:hypothetical protein